MPQFHPGKQVYATGHFLSNKRDHFNAGFAPRRTGPHTVLERIAGDVYIINQEGRQVKIHGNQLYRAKLPTEDNRREHLPSENSGDGEQPHDDRDSSNSNGAPTRPTASNILSSARPPPPHHSSNRSKAPTRPTASDVLSSTQPPPPHDSSDCDEAPMRSTDHGVLNGTQPPPPDSGQRIQPTNHEATGLQPCSMANNKSDTAPSCSTPTRLLRSARLCPIPHLSSGRAPLMSGHHGNGKQPYTEADHGMENSNSTSLNGGKQPQSNANESKELSYNYFSDEDIQKEDATTRKRYDFRADWTAYYRDSRVYTPRKRSV